MALRTRLFLFFGGLIALLVTAEAWLVRTLTRDLEGEVGQVAFLVGSSVMDLFAEEVPEGGAPVSASSPSESPHGTFKRAFAVRFEPDAGTLWSFDDRHDALRLRQDGSEPAGPPAFVRTEGRICAPATRAGHVCDPARLAEAQCHLDLGDEEHVERTATFQIQLAGDWMGAEDGAPANVFKSSPQNTGETTLAITHLADRMHELPPFAHEIPIPRGGLDRSIESFRSQLLLGSFAILGLGLVVAGYVAHRVSVPLRGLAEASQEVGEGALGTQVRERGDREVVATISAFNRMSTRLRDLDAEASVLRDREHLGEIGELARGLAHSLRNPLHLLGLSVDQLAQREPAPGSGERELAAAARAQIERIDRSLRSFLALSSGGAGVAAEVAVDELAQDVALELLQQARGSVLVRVECTGGPVRIAGFAPELRAMIHTLVVNAVEASNEGGEVRVLVTAQDAGARVEVLDEGAGIPPAVRERLFTPHLTTKENGAGLGLYLAHRIAVSRYSGSLELRPRSGPGTEGTCAILVLSDRRSERDA